MQEQFENEQLKEQKIMEKTTEGLRNGTYSVARIMGNHNVLQR